mmetsp:Transcript_11267/g.16610  ORF Transcript_11267/g.16610 Transcript_11267/m.16610 type:complete len:94 (-) Transcript_11267:512-793(-)
MCEAIERHAEDGSTLPLLEEPLVVRTLQAKPCILLTQSHRIQIDAIGDFSGVEFRPVLEGLEVFFVDFEGVDIHPERGEVVGVEPLIRADVED